MPVGNVEDFWVAFPYDTLTPREQELWGVLGWNAENWEDGASNVPASNTTLWANLTADEQAAAAMLGYDELSWDDANTWSLAQELAARQGTVAFADLTPQMQKRWAVLGWNADNWNFPADAPASMSRFSSQLTAEEQIAAAELGYSETMWNMNVIRKPDGEINQFWNGFAYDDLTRAEQATWAVLGWHGENWAPAGEVPATEYKTWANLAPEEQAAAIHLGYDKNTWGCTGIGNSALGRADPRGTNSRQRTRLRRASLGRHR